MKESYRKERLNELFHRAISEVMAGLQSRFGGMLSVVKTRLTADYQHLYVYLSYYGKNKKEEVFNKVVEMAPQIRRQFAGKVGYTVRRIPELHFIYDNSVDTVINIDKLISGPEEEN